MDVQDMLPAAVGVKIAGSACLGMVCSTTPTFDGVESVSPPMLARWSYRALGNNPW